jgi:hypothetical protein
VTDDFQGLSLGPLPTFYNVTNAPNQTEREAVERSTGQLEAIERL